METSDLKNKENNAVETPDVKTVETPETKPVETPEAKSVETPENEKKSKEDDTNDASTETKAEEKKDDTEEKKENPHPLVLKNLDVDFAFEVLGTPTYSRHEYRMVSFIILWARANKIKYEFDKKGNVYLTKGELQPGEYYPCVTSHLDTVQDAQEAYAQCGVDLQIKERINSKGGHELYVEDTGIGADDKAGILISLSLFNYFDKLKACFFLEEEIGCKGSDELDKKWFDNVGYVIGWDSPDRNRAAYACSGELLMSKEFFEKIKDTCKENGVTDFRSEPFTDVKEIRKKTEVMCMNFGNGGYNAHMTTEYVVLEDIDGALGLGIALIKLLGTEKYRMPSKSSYGYNSKDEDTEYFSSMNRYGGNYNYNYNRGSSYTGGSSKSTPVTGGSSTKTEKKDNKVESHVLEYVVERYEKHIDNIQMKCEEREAQILHAIKKLIEDGDGKVTYQDVVNIFNENLSSEPFSTAIEF